MAPFEAELARINAELTVLDDRIKAVESSTAQIPEWQQLLSPSCSFY